MDTKSDFKPIQNTWAEMDSSTQMNTSITNKQ